MELQVDTFTKISESETESTKVLVNDFHSAYKSQKDEAKNQPYYPACWKPLEGQWEQVGKMKTKLLFNGIESEDTLIVGIPCTSIPTYQKISYHLEGNLLLSDLNPLQSSEIFRLAGNYKSDAFYRVGCYQIWKVEGSTCMLFKLSENDMMSTMFWSTQEPISVYHKVANADVEKNPTVTSDSYHLMVHRFFFLFY